jgi:hypothetical protein
MLRSVHAIRGSTSARTAEHPRRRPRAAGDRAGKHAIPFIDRPDLSWTNNETPPAINRGCSAQVVLAPVTVVVVALFGLARLVDQRRLGGVELQTRVPCSYPAL